VAVMRVLRRAMMAFWAAVWFVSARIVIRCAYAACTLADHRMAALVEGGR
jgi:hypothetical protein